MRGRQEVEKTDKTMEDADRNAINAWKAALDPTTRKRALKLLTKEVDDIFLPLGFVRKGVRWHRTGWFATTFVEIQKSRYGNACFINFGRDARDADWRAPSYRNNTHWRIASLAQRDAACRLDQLPYAELDGASELRLEVVFLLRNGAAPFLEQAQGLFGFILRPRRSVEDELRRRPAAAFRRVLSALLLGRDDNRGAGSGH
ncbi:hypothetical protein IE4872_PD00568 (plasmid) [Rhizobium gallicum]|uniref:DUF4304 domain-containing protein n=1 Tax=Rhizobium gallicum TaxID=56730 RepID=A0A1L5NT94_9HYPH|nr:hypothetical protein IE4872_PD00568 [Rhizobium gallicum]